MCHWPGACQARTGRTAGDWRERLPPGRSAGAAVALGRVASRSVFGVTLSTTAAGAELKAPSVAVKAGGGRDRRGKSPSQRVKRDDKDGGWGANPAQEKGAALPRPLRLAQLDWRLGQTRRL